ncbi:cation:proton antiporter [sulfur-oxidizing endosymbiont of Gigantopelta aegis]|uniref:cation:proton antiporter n=1 Tax=sulfur-oxidizing endosymbiont of Gigantopelta aegis TaxID=2794934 RepID=UPI001FEB3EF9|nr:cation:proton antiporter [sulfur-oxidizing endosymbiont of Gigantopelta aegis]
MNTAELTSQITAPETSSGLISLMNFERQTGVDMQINMLEITALVLIALATLMCLYRLLFGPTNPDRIVSADALSVIATIMLCIIAAIFQSVLYLDVALIYGVLSFVGIIALARAIEGDRS